MTPPLLQRRTKDSHDKTELVGYDHSHNRDGISDKDDDVIRLIEQNKALTASRSEPDPTASCHLSIADHCQNSV